MTFFKMAAGAALLALIPTTAISTAALAQTAPTAAECEAWFTKADINKDNSIGQDEEYAKYNDMITKGAAASAGSAATTTTPDANATANTTTPDANATANTTTPDANATANTTTTPDANAGETTASTSAAPGTMMQRDAFLAACAKGTFGMPMSQ